MIERKQGNPPYKGDMVAIHKLRIVFMHYTRNMHQQHSEDKSGKNIIFH
jgi:hypothetical protein